MTFLDALYRRSPVFVQEIGATLYNFGLRRRRYGGEFRRHVQTLVAREAWTQSEFHDLQRETLQRIVDVAWRSPFYRQRFLGAGLERGQATSLNDLALLPILSKENLRSQGRMLLTRPLTRDCEMFKSSGTTGTPTEVFRSRETDRWIWAFWEARCWRWGGASYRSKKAVFGAKVVHTGSPGRPPFWRRDLLGDMVYYSIYHLSGSTIPLYCGNLRATVPELVMGPPSVLAAIAQYLTDVEEPLAGVQLVVTTSEVLDDLQRRTIESGFAARCIDQYGAGEACVFAATCEAGRYHVSSDFGILEVLGPDGKAVGPGGTGEAVCTGLLNDLQPLIRYRLGDVVTLGSGHGCECGRSLPCIERVEGRLDDVLETIDGRRISRFTSIFKGLWGVREAQVAQVAPGRFEVRLVPDERFDASAESEIRTRLEHMLGDGHAVAVRQVAQIERTARGKLRAVVNETRPT